MGDLTAALILAFGMLLGYSLGMLVRYIRSKFH